MSITIWQGEQVVNTENPDVQRPDVAVLSNGQYIVVWTDIAISGDERLLGRVYEADGTAAGDVLELFVPASGYAVTNPAVAGLPNGDFAVAYMLTGSGDSNSSCTTRVFEADGALITSLFYTALARLEDAPDITVVGDGFNVSVSREFSTNPDNVYTVGYGPNAGSYQQIENNIVSDTSVAGSERQSSITYLANGNLALAYVEEGEPFVRVIETDGTLVSPEISVDGDIVSWYTHGGPEITALANGGFVVTYAGLGFSDPFASGLDVYARIFGPGGDALGDAFRVNLSSAGAQGSSIVSETSDGGFIVLYADRENDFLGGRLFDGFGNPLGGEFTLPVENLSDIDIENIAVDTMQDGRIVVTYVSGLTSVDDSDTEINTMIIDPRGTTINGTTDAEVMYGSFFDDAIFGHAGNDELRGMEGRDQLFGGAGNDNLNGGSDADFLDGGSGFDTADYSQDTAAVGIRLDGVEGFGSALGDIFVNMEAATGSDYNDIIVGSNTGNVLRGGLGNDTIYAQGGTDTIIGGEGNNTLFGQDGNDTFFLRDGVNAVNGGAGTDTADYAQSTQTVIVRLDGLASGGGATGDTFVSVENINAGFGNDALIGNGGANVLNGRGGNDTILAGSGADTLEGREGNDTLYGQAGSDMFVFEDGFGFDRIADFSTADVNEQISLTDVTAITNYADLTANHLVTDLNGDAVIVDGGNSITLTGVSIAQLDASDFVFV